MNRSEAINELAAALSKAQGAFENPKKNREVRVTSKRTGATYKFSYATFDEIVDCIRKPLADNGLSFTQGVNGAVITTMLLHASGQWLSTELPIKAGEADNAAQAMGSAITYAKRYALTAMLGIASEEDDDGNAADGNVIDQSRYSDTQKRAASKPPATPTGASHKPGNLDQSTRNGAAEQWAEQFAGKMKACRSIEERRALWDASAKYLDRLETGSPDLHARLLDTYGELQDAGRSVVEAA